MLLVGRQLAEALSRRPLGAGFLFLTGHNIWDVVRRCEVN